MASSMRLAKTQRCGSASTSPLRLEKLRAAGKAVVALYLIPKGY
jgi:hypothetical protein